MTPELSRNFEIIDSLPRLSIDQELETIKICGKGEIFSLGENFSTRFHEPLGIPSVIEIGGLPDLRKSTLTEKYTEELNKVGIASHMLAEQIHGFTMNAAYHYNMTMYQLTSHDLIKTLFTHTDGPIEFVDRGLYGQLAFLDYQFNSGMVEEYVYEISKRYIVNHIGGFVDGLLICTASPENCFNPNSNWLTIEKLQMLKEAY